MKILSRPRGNAEEYGRWAVNPYLGCGHGCLYCYLRKGVWTARMGRAVPELKAGVAGYEHAYHLAMAEILEHREEIMRDGGLFMSFTSDPCAPGTRELFFRIAAGAVDNRVNVTMLTKDATFFQYGTLDEMLRDAERLTSLPDADQRRIIHDGMMFTTWLGDLRTESVRRRVAFGFTLTGHDELEPDAPTNAERLTTLKKMADSGYRTWASIEPVIDFDASSTMITAALEGGCRHFKIGLLTSNTHTVRRDFSFGGHHFPAYSRDEAVRFAGHVMEATEGLATVYWKRSFLDLLGTEPVHGMAPEEFLGRWHHSVGRDWNMFGKER